MVQAQFILELLKVALDPPTDFRQTDEFLKRNVFRYRR